jgi:hypothetical protein
MIREGRGVAGHRVGEGKGCRRDLDGERRWHRVVIWFGRGGREREWREGGRERERGSIAHARRSAREDASGGRGRAPLCGREGEGGWGRGQLSGVRIMCSRYIYKERITGP